MSAMNQTGSLGKLRQGAGKIAAVLIQSVVVQLCGLLFFYLLSIRLSAADFGLLSWANAVSLFLGTVVGFGLEQIVLRRVAAGSATSAWAATALFLHSLVLSAFLLGVLFLVRLFLGEGHPGLQLLPVWFAIQSLNLLVIPLKSILNARARYMPYALIALLSNTGRIISLVWAANQGYALDLTLAAKLMAGFAAFELLATATYIWTSPHRPPLRFPRRAYRGLLKEAMPQYLSVLFDISLARADWILLGILNTDAATGYYSFSYRAFELLRIPAVGISLLLTPWLAPLLGRTERLEADDMLRVNTFYRLEMVVLMLGVVLLNITWTPVVGELTQGRYGAVNSFETLLLSCCLPLHYSINLFWMLAFSSRRYKDLARITVVSSVLNLTANALLIPTYGSRGAAIAFVLASAVQAVLYFRLIRKAGMGTDLRPFVICGILGAILLGAGWRMLPYSNLPLTLVAVTAVYLLTTYLARQWRSGDFRVLRQLLTR